MSLENIRAKTDEGVWNLRDAEEKVADAAQWGLVGAKAYKGFSKTQSQLPAGVYSVTVDRNDDKALFIRRDLQTDNLVDLSEGLSKAMSKEIQTFWGKSKAFKNMGFLHRRGYLLYGPQGTGKSSVVKQIVIDVVERGGLVLLCDNPKFLNQALVTLRQTEPNRSLVCVFEDIDAIIGKYGDDDLLSILDGANMIDHVLNIATTNYPERLDRRIVARPRRFDRIVKIGMPSEQVRREFLKSIAPKMKVAAFNKLALSTEGLSMAGLTELIISVYCLGNNLETTIAILKAMENNNPSSTDFDKGGALGFAADFGASEESEGGEIHSECN